jgi:predicted RNase H-like nuclease (RuvC/YqgF family)
MIELTKTVSDSVIVELKNKITADEAIQKLLPTDDHFKAMFKVLRDMTETDKSWNDMSDDLASLSEDDKDVLRYYGALRTAKCRSKSDKKDKKKKAADMTVEELRMALVAAKNKVNELEARIANKS